MAGEPLQYVLGRWGFRRLELAVDRRVLIPRPETEVLAELALEACDRLGARVVVDLDPVRLPAGSRTTLYLVGMRGAGPPRVVVTQERRRDADEGG